MSGYAAEEWIGDSGDRWLTHLEGLESMIAPVGRALLDHAGFGAGESVVDIGCGGGATSIEIAALVGDSGRAAGVDVAPQLIARAQARAAALPPGTPAPDFETLDAETGRPQGAPFDRAFSRFGVMFFQDTVRAFANIGGWIAPGGRIDFACWAGPDRNPWVMKLGEIVRDYVDVPDPDPDAPGPFRLADPDVTLAMLAASGFEGAKVTLWEGEQHVGGAGADPAAAADFALGGFGVGQLLTEKAPDRLGEARARFEALMADNYRDGAVRMQAAAWLVSARSP